MKISQKALDRLRKEDGRRWQEAPSLIQEAMEFKIDWLQVALYRDPVTGITGCSYGGEVPRRHHILTIFKKDSGWRNLFS
jgi:hypothetical protein